MVIVLMSVINDVLSTDYYQQSIINRVLLLEYHQ